MKLSFIGADHEVTGSCHVLEVCNKKILIDCGMEQGKDIYENQEIPFKSSDIDIVLLTHAHIDHSGKLPLLCKEGFDGEIIATFATADLCNIMLRDSAHIQEFEAEWRNRKAKRSGKPLYEPIYDMQDAEAAISKFHPVDYNQKIELLHDENDSENSCSEIEGSCPEVENSHSEVEGSHSGLVPESKSSDFCEQKNDKLNSIEVRFVDMGHLLGSAAIEIWITENGISKKIVFSGDVGNTNQPILREPTKVLEADYVVVESTYGDRVHSEVRPDYASDFTGILRDTFSRGGNVVVPSFAVGRTQELLYFIREIKTNNLLPEFPDFKVYVDSPLANAATSVFTKDYASCFDDEAMALIAKGINPLIFKGLTTTITSDESKLINFDTEPSVIISASGMCEAGRIRHHLKHNLWRKDSTICFVGYQAAGTMGRILIDGMKEVKIFGEPIAVNAKIVQLLGISGHADKNGLLDWLQGFTKKPDKIFVVHGEDEVTDIFAKTVEEVVGVSAFAPYSGGSVDLATGEILSVGVAKKIEKIDK
jgi:metallo-beta-lactamase family protein